MASVFWTPWSVASIGQLHIEILINILLGERQERKGWGTAGIRQGGIAIKKQFHLEILIILH